MGRTFSSKICPVLFMALWSTFSEAQVCTFPFSQNPAKVQFFSDYCSSKCAKAPRMILFDGEGNDPVGVFTFRPACPAGSDYIVDLVMDDDRVLETLVVKDSMIHVLDCNGLEIAIIDGKPGKIYTSDSESSVLDFRFHVTDQAKNTIAWVFTKWSTDNYFVFHDDHMVEIAVAHNEKPEDACKSAWNISFTDASAIAQAKDPKVMLALMALRTLLQYTDTQKKRDDSLLALGLGLGLPLITVASVAIVLGVKYRHLVNKDLSSTPLQDDKD